MSSPVTPPLTVSDVADGGSVSGRPITTIEVTDGTLTVSGRTATITTGGGGGSGTVTSITNAADSGTGTAITTSGTFTYTGGTGVTTSVSGTTLTINADNNGDVTATGTPVDNQLAVWDSATSIEGDANLTWDGSTLSVTGALDIDNIKVDGNTISSTDTDGAIDLSPDGAGVVTMYNAYRFPTAVTASNDYVLTAQTDGTTAWAEVSGGSGTVTSVAGSGTSGITVTGGPITTSGTLTVDLDDTAVTPGTYGDASNVAQITVDQQGRITAAADVAISGGGGSPGGSDTEIQFNDGGSFAGNAAMTFDKTSGDEQVLISATSTVAPLKVVQIGTGNCFEVHDQAVDTEAFFVRTDGKVGVKKNPGAGLTYDLEVNGETLSERFTSSVLGTVGSPAFRFQADGNTGIYSPTGDHLSITTGGVETLRAGASGLQAIPVGSAAVPSISFATDTDTGLFHTGTNEIGFVTAGTERLAIGSSGELLVGGSAAGDDGQVLTSGGSGAAIAWETAGGGNEYNVELCGVTLDTDGTGYGVFDVMSLPPFGVARYTTVNIDTKQYFFPFIAPFTNDLGTLYYNITSPAATATNLYLAVYEDNEGVPGDVMGYATIDATVSGSASTTSFSSSIALVRGTQFWCAYNKSTSEGITMRAVDSAYVPRISPSSGFPSTTAGYATNMTTNSDFSSTPANVVAAGLEPGVVFGSLGYRPHLGFEV